MPTLFFTDDKKLICELTPAQLDFLRELLVDEDSEDRDYFVDKDTLEMLKDEGCDKDLLSALEQALGDREGIDVSWST